jgi:uncharacterized protein (DUF1778 family)
MGYHRIELRVTPEHSALITAAAECKGLAVATWLRMVALDAARKDIRAQNEPRVAIKEKG